MTQKLSLDLNQDTLSFFFPTAKTAKERDPIAGRVRAAFDHLNGTIQSLSISDTQVTLEWNPKAGGLDSIIALLTQGNYADAILLLEFLRSASPDDADILYNLGMAYSDQNQLARAIQTLSRLMEVEPAHVNGRVALGVAYLRNQNDEAGIRELQTAVNQEPENPWARRSLGSGLLRLKRFADAVEHLRTATELAPQDQVSWFSYGQALDAADSHGADAAYVRAIELDEFSPIADRARKARSEMAKKTFREASPLRMDAVAYLTEAIKLFDGMGAEEAKRIGFEIAVLGTQGIDVNNPSRRYTLKNLPGEFSGLHLLSIQYVAFKKFAPEQNIGFDLSAEYAAALKMFKPR
jgi:Flp pilus assembly protein TadD